MYTISREFTFCYGHRLLDYNGKCAHLHGHNAKVLITLESEQLDSQGMVLDFSELKRTVGGWIEKNIDHKMVLRKDDPMVPVLRNQQEPLFLMETSPTAENLARLLFDYVRSLGFPVMEVRFWETEKCVASYVLDFQKPPGGKLPRIVGASEDRDFTS